MNYAQEILTLRDKMHKDIVQSTLRLERSGDEFHLELMNPFSVWITESFDDDYQVKIAIMGICGTTGELITRGITENAYCDLTYNDLTMEQLAYLHRQIETESFTINVF
jgi:hypothetical protein